MSPLILAGCVFIVLVAPALAWAFTRPYRRHYEPLPERESTTDAFGNVDYVIATLCEIDDQGQPYHLPEHLLAQNSPGDTHSDRNIWLMKKRGWSNEQIAARYGKKESAIQAACYRYELYRDGFANTEVDFELNKMMTDLMPKTEKVPAKAEVVETLPRYPH